MMSILVLSRSKLLDREVIYLIERGHNDWSKRIRKEIIVGVLALLSNLLLDSTSRIIAIQKIPLSVGKVGFQTFAHLTKRTTSRSCARR